jgi:hypothetical protein
MSAGHIKTEAPQGNDRGRSKHLAGATFMADVVMLMRFVRRTFSGFIWFKRPGAMVLWIDAGNVSTLFLLELRTVDSMGLSINETRLKTGLPPILNLLMSTSCKRSFPFLHSPNEGARVLLIGRS